MSYFFTDNTADPSTMVHTSCQKYGLAFWAAMWDHVQGYTRLDTEYTENTLRKRVRCQDQRRMKDGDTEVPIARPPNGLFVGTMAMIDAEYFQVLKHY